MVKIENLALTQDCFGKSVLGIRINLSGDSSIIVTDISKDMRGASPVDASYYGLSHAQATYFEMLNKALDDATNDALNAGCLAIQTVLGVKSGDYAGMHYSGLDNEEPIRRSFAEYLMAEVNLANAEDDAN